MDRLMNSPTGVRVSLALIVGFFGSSLPAYKLAADSFGPATSNLIRFVIAATALGAVARHRLPADRSVRLRMIGVGMLGLGLMTVLMGTGVDRGSAIIGSVVVGLEPIGVAIAGALLAGDRLSRRTLVALAVGFTGALVASGLFTQRTGPSPLLPVVLLLGTVAAFSVYTARVRTIGAGVDPLATAALTQVGALAFVIPACLFDISQRSKYSSPTSGLLAPFRGMIRGDITGRALGAALFLGVGSAVSYLLLCVVLARQPASRVAVTLYLTPLVGVLCSWAVVGEALHLRDAAGAVLVLIAIAISELKGASRTRRTEASA
jgi:drug/metabolite transporter (DMT)-like permease